MARYKCQTGGLVVDETQGVMDTETGGSIPPSTDNRHWVEYLEWKALGNTPDCECTQEQWDLRQAVEEVTDLTQQLKKAAIWQFRMLLELFQVGKANGVWVNTDFSAEIRAKAADWKTKVDRLSELGE